MKSTVVLLLTFLILLLGFFSPHLEYTGDYARSSSLGSIGKYGAKLLLEGKLSPSAGNVGERRAYLIRDRNVDPRLVLTSVTPSGLSDTYKYSKEARTGIYSLYEGTSKGDVNCDGKVTHEDVLILTQALWRLHRLDSTLEKVFSANTLSRKYLGAFDGPTQECLLKGNGDMNFNNRIDYADVKLLDITTEAERPGHGPEYGRREDNFARRGVASPEVAGREVVTQYGYKCIYKQIEGSPYWGYEPADCELPSDGYKWMQNTDDVRQLPINYQVRQIETP